MKVLWFERKRRLRIASSCRKSALQLFYRVSTATTDRRYVGTVVVPQAGNMLFHPELLLRVEHYSYSNSKLSFRTSLSSTSTARVRLATLWPSTRQQGSLSAALCIYYIFMYQSSSTVISCPRLLCSFVIVHILSLDLPISHSASFHLHTYLSWPTLSFKLLVLMKPTIFQELPPLFPFVI